MSHDKNVLFVLTGSIACYKACTVISRLTQAGVAVQTAVTSAALHFIGKSTLEGLSGRPVFDNLWEEGRALEHIGFARRADLALVCPATANTINALAAGTADDPLGSLFLAWEFPQKPWWIAPAMNVKMWEHPATRASVEKLRGWGVKFIAPDAGMQACGEEGPGRLPDPEKIAAAVLKALGASVPPVRRRPSAKR